MKKQQRAKKGTVKIEKTSRLQLVWTDPSGKRNYLTTGPNTPSYLQAAEKVAKQIESDMAAERAGIHGVYDYSREKYKPKPPAEPEAKSISTAELFELFTEHRRSEGTSGQAITARYRPLLANLKRFGKDIESEAVARKFIGYLRSRQSPLVANQNLSLLRGFADWAVTHEHIDQNHFAAIKRLKHSHTPAAKRKPFTAAEVRLLLDTAKTHPTLYK